MEPKIGGLWERLGVPLERLGSVSGRHWSRLGGVLGRLGPPWGVMWASWERLGGILCPIFSPKGVNFRHAILDAIFQMIFLWILPPNIGPRILKKHSILSQTSSFFGFRLF